MADDIHTVLVESALKRVEVLDVVREDAGRVDAAALVASAQDADALAEAILTEAIRASVKHMQEQLRDSLASVTAEAAALRQADPATVKAVTSQEIAARKAAKIRGDADG